MNKLKIAVFALMAMFIFTGCSVKNKSDIVKINDTVITKFFNDFFSDESRKINRR